MYKRILSNKRYVVLLGLQILFGATAVLAFAPFALWWVHLIVLPFTFLSWRYAKSARQAAVLGGVWATAYFFIGMYWLIGSMRIYGEMAFAEAVGFWLFGAFLLSLFMAFFAFFVNRYRHSIWFLAWLWTALEWLRGTIFFAGMPWLSLGYAQTVSPLAGFAAFIGVYGVSFLVVTTAFLVLALGERGIRLRKGLFYLLLIGLIWGGAFIAKDARFTKPLEHPLAISLVQTNIPQIEKFSEDFIDFNITKYQHLILRAKANLIILPESILPLLLPPWPEQWWPPLTAQLAADKKIAMGVLSVQREGGIKNSIWVMDTKGTIENRYSKSHLLPFGEYIPQGFTWLVQKLQIPMNILQPGAMNQKPTIINHQGIRSSLLFNTCYEDVFGEELAQRLRQHDANILVNISNFAWFGNSLALPQHLQMAQMRTLELQKPFVSATNTGLTAYIDAHGKIVEQLAPQQTDILEVSVTGTQGLTPFALFGYRWFMILSLIVLLLSIYRYNSR